jgi:hypothetical protein
MSRLSIRVQLELSHLQSHPMTSGRVSLRQSHVWVISHIHAFVYTIKLFRQAGHIKVRRNKGLAHNLHSATPPHSPPAALIQMDYSTLHLSGFAAALLRNVPAASILFSYPEHELFKDHVDLKDNLIS